MDETLRFTARLVVENKDWTHWTKVMGIEPIEEGSGRGNEEKDFTTKTWSCRFCWWYEIWTSGFTECIGKVFSERDDCQSGSRIGCERIATEVGFEIA